MAENDQGQQGAATGSAAGQQQGDPAGQQQPPEDVTGLKNALIAERNARAAERNARALAETQYATATTNLSTLAAERDDLKAKWEAVEAVRPALETKAVKADRYEACQAAGLDLTWWDRLKGSTPEEWLTDAKALAGQVGSKGAGTPAPDGSAGRGAGSGSGSAGSVTSRMDQIRAERAASGR